jgi:hypothetical protein
MTVTHLPSSSSHLRVPFIFMPDGTADLTALAQFKADYPGWVSFRATFRPQPGSPPLDATLAAMTEADEHILPVEEARTSNPREPSARLAAPRIVKQPPPPPPRLPSAQAPLPAAYTGPQSLTGAFAASMASATGRAALIRSTQAMLNSLPGQAARAAVVAEFMNPAAVAGTILLTPNPAGAGEEQALRRALAGLKAKGGQHFDMPPRSPPLPGLVPPPLPRLKPGEGGFTPTPAEKPRPGFTPAPPPRPIQPGRPPVANTPVILDSRKTEPSYSGETELSRILAPGGQPVGWVEKRTKLNIRTVTATQFAALKEELLKNAAGPESDKDYDGKVYQLPDGERFGLRISKNHGETIDVMSRATTQLDRNLKIHWNPGNDRRTKAP